MRGVYIDMVGHTYGRLTVLRRAPNKGRHAAFACRCECGAEGDYHGYALRNGNTTQCLSCARAASAAAMNAAMTPADYVSHARKGGEAKARKMKPKGA